MKSLANLKRSRAMMGHIVTPKTRRKISESEKGKKVSLRTRELIRKARIGTARSKETIAKIKAWRATQVNTPESNRKRGIAMSGRNNPQFGTHHSALHRHRISEGMKRIWEVRKTQ